MGRPPCCDKSNVKRGLWTAEEDAKLLAYVSNYGTGNWTLVPKKAGLNRCGKSCRLRWTNYLRPDLKHDSFTPQEEELIINLHQAIGSRWSLIAKQLPGRTDNDVKNYWNTKLRKRLSKMGIDPITHKPFSQIFSEFGNISGLANTTANRMGSFNKNLNNKLMSKTEPSSIITGLSKMSINPIMEQVQDNSFASNPSWDFMAQFQVTNQDTVQPHFFGEVTSSCSSSSPTTATRLSSPQAYSCQPSLAQITPTSPFIWSEYLLSDPILSADFQQQKEPEFQGMLSASNSSSLTQNDISHCKFNSGNDHNLNRVEHEDSGIYYGEDTSGNQANKNADASCSSASSFVDAILDRDSEMGSQFPKLLDGCFDY